jgi:hypothetical protein
MRSAVIVLLLACVAIAYAAPVNKRATATATVAYSGNVTLTNNTQTQTLAYRSVTAEANAFNLNLGPFNLDYGFFLSDALQLTKSPGQSTADLVASGFFYLNAVGLTAFPEAFSGYFSASTKWGGAASVVATLTTSLVSGLDLNAVVNAAVNAFGDLNASTGLASITFYGISEVNANGQIVKNFTLNNLVYSGTATVQTDSTGNIKYAQFTASGASGETYTFTTLTSQVVGKLQYGAILTPKSVNVMIEIDNYQYQTATNYLQLSYIAGYATANFAGNFSVNGNYIASGTAPNAAYISTSTQASSNGAMTTVTATINTNINPATFTQSAKLFGSYFASVNPSFGAALVTVNLPAGSETIIYDPTTGFEQPTNSSANLGISIVSVFIISLLATYFNL